MNISRSTHGRGWPFALVIALTVTLTPGLAAAAEEGPMTLKEGAWVCGTRDAYHQARDGSWEGPTFSIEKFRAGTQEPKACIYVDDDLLEDMMAPFVKVAEHDGTDVRVSFIIEFYKRIEYLHRKFSRIEFSGWTDAANVEIRKP